MKESNDTAPWAEAKLRELMAQRTGAERVWMATQMFEDARALARANLLGTNPGMSEPELRLAIFERMYAGDFAPEAWERILARLRVAWGVE